MDLRTKKHLQKLFENIGPVEIRAMFGAYGVFVHKVMLALYSDGKLHLRTSFSLKKEFELAGLKPYTVKRGDHSYLMHYYTIGPELAISSCTITDFARRVYIETVNHFENKRQDKKLRQLPNLRLKIERMLKNVGILTVEDLESIGAVTAYKSISEHYSNNIGLDLLWALEGAIRGVHWSVLPKHVRSALLCELSKNKL